MIKSFHIPVSMYRIDGTHHSHIRRTGTEVALKPKIDRDMKRRQRIDGQICWESKKMYKTIICWFILCGLVQLNRTNP